MVALTGALALAMGAAVGSAPLTLTLAGSLLLGIVYSADVPFLRWKRSPVLAAACILAVRCAAYRFRHTWPYVPGPGPQICCRQLSIRFKGNPVLFSGPSIVCVGNVNMHFFAGLS